MQSSENKEPRLLTRRYFCYETKGTWRTAGAIYTDDGWILYGGSVEDHPSHTAALKRQEELNAELEKELGEGKDAVN